MKYTPAEYMPECFDSDKICFICNLDFNTNENLREHAKMVHKEHVKKCWSNDAMANIFLYHEYKHWLESPYVMEIEKTPEKSKMLPLRERNLNIIQPPEAYM